MANEIERLDLLLMRIRRLAFQPDPGSQLVPGLEHPVPTSRVYACTLIADSLAHSVNGQLSIKDVALSMNLEHSSASRLLTELEHDGLVLRVPDVSDRRRTNIELTDLGRSLVADVSKLRHWVMSQILTEIEPGAVKQMADTMELILDTAQNRLPELLKSAETEHGLKVFPETE
jgi:DNA-binding MarR family transcriptional regulator